MPITEYLAKRFVGKEICVALDNDDAETIIFSEVWAHNKAYFRGTVINIDDEMLELEIQDVGNIHINCNYIKTVWQPPFSWRKAIHVFLTDKPRTPSGR